MCSCTLKPRRPSMRRLRAWTTRQLGLLTGLLVATVNSAHQIFLGDERDGSAASEVVLVECVVLLDVTLGGPVDDVAHLETFDGLILSDTTTTVHATANVGVTLVLLSAPVVSSLRWHV